MSVDAQAEILKQMNFFAPPLVNPIDLIALKGAEAYVKIMEIVARQEYIDGLIISYGYGRFDRTASSRSMISRLKQTEAVATIPDRFNKPLIIVNETLKSGPIYEIYKRHHVPFLDSPLDCAKAMHGLVKYQEQKNR